MANTDVQVKEIQLLEAYKGTFDRFMSSTINMTHRLRNTACLKNDEARAYAHNISDICNIAQQKLAHARNALEASQKRRHNERDLELQHRTAEYKKCKELYEKAKNYEESSKKLYNHIHAETERFEIMTNSIRHNLEMRRNEGMGFLEKAVEILKDYRQ